MDRMDNMDNILYIKFFKSSFSLIYNYGIDIGIDWSIEDIVQSILSDIQCGGIFIDADPASAITFSRYQRRAAAAEWIQDNAAFGRGRDYDTLQEGERLLRRVADALASHIIDRGDEPVVWGFLGLPFHPLRCRRDARRLKIMPIRRS